MLDKHRYVEQCVSSAFGVADVDHMRPHRTGCFMCVRLSRVSTDEFLTVAEVAGMLKLNQQTVRNWIDRGQLPATRVGRRVRIRHADLNTLIQNGGTGIRSGHDATPAAGRAEAFWAGELIPVSAFSSEPSA